MEPDTAPKWFNCCICFEYYPPEVAWKDETGQKWDMCLNCKAIDDEAVRRRDALSGS